MTRPFSTLLRLAALGLFFTTASAQTPPIRIMPVGDSITDGTARGTAGRGGYRGPLYDLLAGAGYHVDYIGSHRVNSELLEEKEHDGHSGWRIDQIDSNITTWLRGLEDPDVILLHIGTNDFGQSYSTTTAINRLDALILKIATLRPYAHLIVTNLMQRGEPQNTRIQEQFNPFVQGVVSAHAAAGHRVTFLDMRSVVPLSDMPDNLHPNQTGYDKMASAWFAAIQAVITPNGDANPPHVARAYGDADLTHVRVRFSKPVSDASADPAHFTIDQGLTVTAAELDETKRIVTLTTTPQTAGASYTLAIRDVEDRILPAPNPIAPDTTATFTGAIPRGYSHHVPESSGYSLVQSLDLPDDANYGSLPPAFSIDESLSTGLFDRIAYYLELQTEDGGLQYVWVSTDAFTQDAGKIGVPTLASGAIFQQDLADLHVTSNVPGLATGSGIAGRIEFWPFNYDAANASNVPGASATAFDFGDAPRTTGRYGSMQIHNLDARQTVFAFNNWGSFQAPADAAQNIDLGIGNGDGENSDWTFAQNGSVYTVKTLQILVRRTGDVTAPAIRSAQGTAGGNRVILEFDEPVLADSIDTANFQFDHSVIVLGVETLADPRRVAIATTRQPDGVPLTLTLSGIRDTSPNANRIAPGTTIAVTPAQLPAEIAANAGTAAQGYELVYSFDLPVIGDLNGSRRSIRFDDSAAAGPFTRIAYYLELQQPGQPSRYVWTSMDAFTADRRKIAFPLLSNGAAYQKILTNLQVVSNVPGVTNGSGITTGNIEFWPNNYTIANGLPIRGASDSTFDFGDTRSSTSAYYGSMQIHNHGARQTVFAINHFGTDGQVLEMGIGNSSSENPDWTFTENAATYSKRVLHVLVLPGPTTPAAQTQIVPEAENYQLVAEINLPASGNLVSGAGFPGYAFDYRNEVGPFRRVAYLLELKKSTDAETRYIWTSMDAFTNDPARIAVPTVASGAFFQTKVANLNVFSNVPGIVTGAGIATGNIEFWPGNYKETNGAGIPNASGSTFDFGDGEAGSGTGYGSMQVHNHGASQVLWAVNNWGTPGSTTKPLCLGIGNQPTGHPDWTHAENGASYEFRRLRVYVLPGSGDETPPAITGITPSTDGAGLALTFDEPLADTAADPAHFAFDGGLDVLSAALSADQRQVVLRTSPQTPGASYTLTIGGIRDRSPAGNPVAPGATATFTAFTPPVALAAVPETVGYRLVYQLDIPAASPRWNFNAVPYSVDQTKFGEFGFDRVAYLMQLDSQWIYTSFDAFTHTLAQIGIPTLGVAPTPFQQNVSNLNVATNVAAIYPDTALRSGLDGGNIEFWGGNYDQANTLGVPNASGSAFDWGDNMKSGGHGSFQVHDHQNRRVLFAMNNWGSNQGSTSFVELGIGSRPTADPDWTHAANGASYTTRRLYVLARPSESAPAGPAPLLLSQPTSRTVPQGGSTTLAVRVSASGPVRYQWRFNGSPLPGATNAWLALENFSPADAGPYDVVVTSATGVETLSATALVSLLSQDEPFHAFLDRHGLSGPEDDRDGDGVNALLEWLLGGDPDLPDASILPVPGPVTGDGFTVTFNVTAALGAATWQLQHGSSLNDWTTAVHGEDGVTITTGPETNGVFPVTVTFAHSAPARFVRLLVTPP